MTTNEILKHLIGNGNKTRFAEKHGITKQYLNQWLSGKRNIKATTLEHIVENEGYKLNVELKLEKL